MWLTKDNWSGLENLQKSEGTGISHQVFGGLLISMALTSRPRAGKGTPENPWSSEGLDTMMDLKNHNLPAWETLCQSARALERLGGRAAMKKQTLRKIKLPAHGHTGCHSHLDSNPDLSLAQLFWKYCLLWIWTWEFCNYVAWSKEGKRLLPAKGHQPVVSGWLRLCPSPWAGVINVSAHMATGLVGKLTFPLTLYP